MKALLGKIKKIRGKLQAFKELFGKALAWRHRILAGFAIAVGLIWMACGWLLDEPKSVLIGFGLLMPVGWAAGYRLGKWLQDRKRPPAADASEGGETTAASNA